MSLSEMFFLDDALTALLPSSFPVLKQAATVAVVFLLFSVALAGLSTVMLIAAVLVSTPRQKGKGGVDLGRAYERFISVMANVLQPLAWILASLARFIGSLLLLLFGNLRRLVAIVIVFALALAWTVGYPYIIGAFLRTYSVTIASLWSVVPMYVFLAFRYVIELVWPVINWFGVRLPVAIVSGTFFDLGTCSRDTYRMFFQSLQVMAKAFATSAVAWADLGTGVVVRAPDWGPGFQAVGESIAVLQLFFACVCSSGSLLVSPLFAAIADGRPHRPPDEPTSFACFLNASFNVPVVAVTPIIALFVVSPRPALNGTFDTAYNVIHCGPGILDDVVQQYTEFFVNTGTTADTDDGDGEGEGALSFPLPPRIFSCVADYLWAGAPGFNDQVPVFPIPRAFRLTRFVRSPAFWKVALNALFNADTTFTTWDGQLRLRLDDVFFYWGRIFTCICDIVRWIGNILGFIADVIILDGNMGSCVGRDALTIGGEVGVCVLKIVEGLLDIVCCWIEAVVALIFEFSKFVYNTIVGTVYTIITRAFVENTEVSECFPPGGPAAIDPVYRNFCTVPRPPFFFNSYLYFQWGDRQVIDAAQFCPDSFCNHAWSCQNDGDCSGLADAAAVCDPIIQRCVAAEPRGTNCAVREEGGPTAHSLCLHNATAQAGGLCATGVCDSGVGSGNVTFAFCAIPNAPAPVSCTCQCARNEFTIAFVLTTTEFFECIYRFLVTALGPDLETIGCFIVQTWRVFAEFLNLIVDVIIHLDTFLRLGQNPEPVNISATQLLAAARQWIQCGTAGIRNAAPNAAGSGIVTLDQAVLADVLSDFLKTLSEAWDAVANALLKAVETIGSIALELFFSVKELRNVDTTTMEAQVKATVQFVVEAIAGLLKGVGAVIKYALGPLDVIGEVLVVIGDLLLSLAMDLACLFADLFKFIVRGIIGIILLPVDSSVFLDWLAAVGKAILDAVGLTCTVDDIACLLLGFQIYADECSFEDSFCNPDRNPVCQVNEFLCEFVPFIDFPLIHRPVCAPYEFCDNCCTPAEVNTEDMVCLQARDMNFTVVGNPNLRDICSSETLRCGVPYCWDPYFRQFGLACYEYISNPPTECSGVVTAEEACYALGQECNNAVVSNGTVVVADYRQFCCDRGFQQYYTTAETKCAAVACGHPFFTLNDDACFVYADNPDWPNNAADDNSCETKDAFLDVTCSQYGTACEAAGMFVDANIVTPEDLTFTELLGECCGRSSTFFPDAPDPDVFCSPELTQCWDTRFEPLNKMCWENVNTRPACQPEYPPPMARKRSDGENGTSSPSASGFSAATQAYTARLRHLGHVVMDTPALRVTLANLTSLNDTLASVAVATNALRMQTATIGETFPSIVAGGTAAGNGTMLDRMCSQVMYEYRNTPWLGIQSWRWPQQRPIRLDICMIVHEQARRRANETVMLDVVPVTRADAIRAMHTFLTHKVGTTLQELFAPPPPPPPPQARPLAKSTTLAMTLAQHSPVVERDETLFSRGVLTTALTTKEPGMRIGKQLYNIVQKAKPQLKLLAAMMQQAPIAVSEHAKRSVHVAIALAAVAPKAIGVVQKRVTASVTSNSWTAALRRQNRLRLLWPAAAAANDAPASLAATVTKCPDESDNVCSLTPCATDMDCIMAVNGTGPVCDDFLRRCVLSATRCAAGPPGFVDDLPCYRLAGDGTEARLSRCDGTAGVCGPGSTASFPADCVCEQAVCPRGTICGLPRCDDDGDCALFNTNCTASVGRCIVDGTVPPPFPQRGCRGAANGTACIVTSDANNPRAISCQMGTCEADVCSIAGNEAFPCNCACQCTPNGSPFECCDDVPVCLGCSAGDRIIFAVANASKSFAEYYRKDYVDRFLPCAAEAGDTVNYMIVNPALACPAGTLCDVPECATDLDCQQSALAPDGAGNNTALTCDPFWGRCAITRAACTAGPPSLVAGQTCYGFEEDIGRWRFGLCTDGTCELAGASFDGECKCPDTFLTVNKTVPWLFDRPSFPVPCQLNITCIRERILPPGTNLTIPSDNPYANLVNDTLSLNGTVDALATNANARFLASLNAFGGLGTRIGNAIEDTVYVVTQVGTTDALSRFAEEFIFSDYDADWYCRLEDTSPPGCCSDRCEHRKQGVGLFFGIVWNLLFLLVPLYFINTLPLLSGCNGLMTAVWLALSFAVTLAYGYGGGLLAYTAAPLALALPLYRRVTRLTLFVLRLVCCGRDNLFVTVFRRMFALLFTALALATFLPGLPTCFAMDAYNLFRELIPPCFPVSATLIDRTQPGGLTPCGTFITETDTFTFPPIINCGTTPLLGQTRFRDGYDVAFYLIEWFDAGRNEQLAQSLMFNAVFGWLQPYAAAHTAAAHASGDPYTDACFRVTFVSIFSTGLELLFQIFVLSLLLSALVLLFVLLLTPCIYSMRAAAAALGQTFDALYAPDTDASNDGTTPPVSGKTKAE